MARHHKTVRHVALKEPMGERASKAAKKTSAPILANSEGWMENGPKSIHRRAPLMLRMKDPRSRCRSAHSETGTRRAIVRR